MNSKNANEKIMVLTICFLAILGVMNATLFNVALSKISSDLAISQSKVSWIVIGYSLIACFGLIIYGKLADRFSVKKLFLIGIVLLLIGSILGYTNNKSYIMIVIARLIQSSGASSFIALSMIAITKMLEIHKRASAISMLSASIVISSGFGPLFGGGITNILGWPYLFLLMLISIIGFLLLIKFMPNDHIENLPQNYKFDFVGSVLLFITVSSILLGISVNKLLFIVAIIGIILCKVWMTKFEHALIDIKLFKNLTFLKICAVAFITYFVMMAIIFLLPMLLENKYNISTSSVGVILFICCLFGVPSTIVTGRLISRLGGIKMIYIASAVMILSFLLLVAVEDTKPIMIIIPTILIYMSLSSIQVCLNNLVHKSLGSDKIGVGLGLYNLLGFLGAPFGPAILSKLLESTGNFTLAFSIIALVVLCNFLLLFKIRQAVPTEA